MAENMIYPAAPGLAASPRFTVRIDGGPSFTYHSTCVPARLLNGPKAR